MAEAGEEEALSGVGAVYFVASGLLAFLVAEGGGGRGGGVEGGCPACLSVVAERGGGGVCLPCWLPTRMRRCSQRYLETCVHRFCAVSDETIVA